MSKYASAKKLLRGRLFQFRNQACNLLGLPEHLRIWALGTGIFILLLPLLLELLMQFGLSLIPKEQGAEAASILILGRGVDSQIQRALVGSRLWNEGRSQSIFVSGMTDAPEIMRALKEMGVPEAKITGERCSKTTWENGLFSKILLHAQAGNRIVLVTDEPHMIRAFLVFRGFGFDVTTHPISHESESFFSPERWRILLREHVALFAYATSGKLQASSITKQRINQVKAHERIVRSGCYLQEKATL